MSTTTTLAEKELESFPIDLTTTSSKKEHGLITVDAASVTSGTTLNSSSAFVPNKTLLINTKGVSACFIASPPPELQISVLERDGSIVYLSTRAKRSSGSCVLTDANGRDAIGTTYFFGPGRHPVLRFLGHTDEEGEIKVASKWTSRTQKFTLPDGRIFQWQYKREHGFGDKGNKGTALVMSMQGQGVAILIRNEDTRTPESKSCSAGNGGELVLGEAVGGKDGILEEVVVATCLLMLKKEIDRRR